MVGRGVLVWWVLVWWVGGGVLVWWVVVGWSVWGDKTLPTHSESVSWNMIGCFDVASCWPN